MENKLKQGMKPRTINLIGLAFGVLALLSGLSGYVIGTSTTWTPTVVVIAILAISLNIYALHSNSTK